MNFYRLNKLSTGYDTKVPKVKMVLLQDSLWYKNTELWFTT
jgi:hypothetical protein